MLKALFWYFWIKRVAYNLKTIALNAVMCLSWFCELLLVMGKNIPSLVAVRASPYPSDGGGERGERGREFYSQNQSTITNIYVTIQRKVARPGKCIILC